MAASRVAACFTNRCSPVAMVEQYQKPTCQHEELQGLVMYNPWWSSADVVASNSCCGLYGVLVVEVAFVCITLCPAAASVRIYSLLMAPPRQHRADELSETLAMDLVLPYTQANFFMLAAATTNAHSEHHSGRPKAVQQLLWKAAMG